MKKIVFLFVLFFVSLVQAVEKDGSHLQADNYYPKLKFDTTMGSFEVELNRRKAPATVNNFLRYVELKMYDNTVFHRVIAEFVIQGGGYDENFREKKALEPVINESGNGLTNDYYTIAMARQDDPHSAKRQFYFNMNDNKSLNPGRTWGYTVFGNVTQGSDVLDSINLVETHYDPISGFADVPKTQVLLKSVTLMPEATFITE